MRLTFDEWIASREAFAASAVPSIHPARDFDVEIETLHVFRDAAWIIQRPDGKFWTIAEQSECEGMTLTWCAVHFWNLHSSYNCTPAEDEVAGQMAIAADMGLTPAEARLMI